MNWHKLLLIVMILSLFALLAVFVVEVVNLFYPPVRWDATEVYPMANANITWEQTYHAGAWGENVKGRK